MLLAEMQKPLLTDNGNMGEAFCDIVKGMQEQISKACTAGHSHQSMHSAQVYDATPFLRDHPGGGDSILIVAGTDATEEFNAIHSDKAKAQLLEYCIGELADENVPGAPPHAVLGPAMYSQPS